jgi:hypothetical protein
MPLNSAGSSSIDRRLIWRQFYYIMETGTLYYLLLMQFTWKKPTPTFKVCWKRYFTKTTNQWNKCADLKVVAILTGLTRGYLKFFASYVNWTGERGTGITMQSTLRWKDSRAEECSRLRFSQQDENIFTPTSHKTLINENICQGDE